MISQSARYDPDDGELAARSVRTIWNHYAGYSAEFVNADEVSASVRENMRVAIRVLQRGTLPTFEELGEGRNLGARRAALGVPLESVTQAYRSTERTLLLDVMAASASWPSEVRDRYVELILSTYDLLTDHMINSYREASATLEDSRRRREEKLLQAIVEGAHGSEVESEARSLGVDLRRSCQAVALLAPGLDPVTLHRVRRRLHETLTPVATGGVVSGDVHGMVLMLFSPRPEVDVVEHLRHTPGLGDAVEDWVVGIGTNGAEAGHAVRTLGEAREVATASVLFGGERIVRQEDVLVDVLLAAHPRIADQFADQLAPLGGTGPLLDTLHALFRNGLSQSAAARDLFVHVNTIAYRLRRIEELTGLNPLDVRDLVPMVLGLRWQRAVPAAEAR